MAEKLGYRPPDPSRRRSILRLIVTVAVGVFLTFVALLIYFALYNPFGPGY